MYENRNDIPVVVIVVTVFITKIKYLIKEGFIDFCTILDQKIVDFIKDLCLTRIDLGDNCKKSGRSVTKEKNTHVSCFGLPPMKPSSPKTFLFIRVYF